MGCRFPRSHKGGAAWMPAICRPQLFVKDMIIRNDTDTSEILISTFTAWQLKWLCSVSSISDDTKNGMGWRKERKKTDEAKRLSKLAFQGEDETIPCKHCLCGDMFKVSQSPLLLKRLDFEISKAT